MAAPGVSPVTTPVVEFTVAIAVLSLLQVPPPVASDSEVVAFTQALKVPEIGAITGKACTVMEAIIIVVQPLPFVKL